MTAGTDEAPWQHGDLVTIHDLPLVVIEHRGPWVEVIPETGDCGFVIHESQVSSR